MGTSVTFAVAVLLMLFPQEAPGICDNQCQEVLAVAANWAISDAKETGLVDPMRVFLSPMEGPVGKGKNVPAPNVLRQVADRLGVEFTSRRNHQAWKACKNLKSQACKGAQGTTYISLKGPNFRSETEAVVQTTIYILNREVGLAGLSGSSVKLLLRKDRQGQWSINDVLFRIVI